MSSRRLLKKEIDKTMELLYADCILYQVYVMGADRPAADEIIKKLPVLHKEFIGRANVSEGKDVKGRARMYFRKLRADSKTKVDEIGKEIEALP